MFLNLLKLYLHEEIKMPPGKLTGSNVRQTMKAPEVGPLLLYSEEGHLHLCSFLQRRHERELNTRECLTGSQSNSQ